MKTVETAQARPGEVGNGGLCGHKRQPVDLLNPRSGMRHRVHALFLEDPPRRTFHKYWAPPARQSLSGDSPVSGEEADPYVVRLEETESAR